MNMRLNLVVFAAVFACVAQAVTSFTYQGRLRNGTGGPIEGGKNKTIAFRLYNQASSEVTTALWGRSVSVLLDDEGLFNVELSNANGNTIPNCLYSDLKQALAATSGSTLYIGVQVGDSGEIRPRQRILEVPFATIAGDVSRASGSFTVDGLLTAGSASIGGTATVTGKATFKSSLEVNGGPTTLKDKLTVSRNGMEVTGAAQFNDAVTMNSSLDAKSMTINGMPVTFVKKGMITLWYGKRNEVPEGWAICDGSNGTPNLQGVFVAGANSDANTGDYGVFNAAQRGANSVTLTVSQMPGHTHEYYSDDSVSFVQPAIANTYQTYGFDFSSDKKKKGSKYTTSTTGGGAAHENRPAFKALYYIMYVGMK